MTDALNITDSDRIEFLENTCWETINIGLTTNNGCHCFECKSYQVTFNNKKYLADDFRDAIDAAIKEQRENETSIN